jgi:glycogen debranching enzyme
MTEVTITQILDDLRAADEITRRFERRYWLDSADFYDLYMQGRLDDGEHIEDFAMWAGFYEVKRDRETALKQLSRERVRQLSASARDIITIDPREPTLRPTAA